MNVVLKKCTNCMLDFWDTIENSTTICDTCELGHNTYKLCEHVWVWSGTPHGMMWCKKCEEDYDKRIHGEIKDLAEMNKL